MVDRFSREIPFHFITYTALRAAIKGQPIAVHDLLPRELVDIAEQVPKGADIGAFKKALRAELDEQSGPEQGLAGHNKKISYDTKRDAELFLSERIEPLLEITQAFAAMASTGSGKADKRFLKLMNLWTKLRVKSERYSEADETNWFFDRLGRRLLIFALWARPDINASAVEGFVSQLGRHTPPSPKSLRWLHCWRKGMGCRNWQAAWP